jgi:formylglycine-generating enzyme required for sulfatase activity
MGCDEGADGECFSEEKPGRRIYLDAFLIDQYEVTVADYRRCVQAGKCSTDSLTGEDLCNWGKQGRDNHPINCVNWNQAKAYCEWAGKRLPTEAEWEKAARGADGRKYSWGNQWDGSKTNAENKVGKTAAVGSYSSGASPYGVHDMIGNVWEWVEDWYDKDYYRRALDQNPTGPSEGKLKIWRGGSWANHAWDSRASFRYGNDPRSRYNNLGFRCAS